MEDWTDVRELVGSAKQIQVQLIFEKDALVGLMLTGDNKKECYAEIPREIFDKGKIDALKVKFQLPKVRKSRFPFQLPALEINGKVFDFKSQKKES